MSSQEISQALQGVEQTRTFLESNTLRVPEKKSVSKMLRNLNIESRIPTLPPEKAQEIRDIL